MPKTYAHIGEVIKARREGLGLTQEQLCERLGWKPGRSSEISEIENGANQNPTLKRLIAFATALDCHVYDLVFMLNTEEGVA